MTRLFESAAYETPQTNWWWQDAPPRNLPALVQDADTEFAIIGGGFTGVNAAVRLAQAGYGVTVLDAEQPGWGASGRNGGFCCLGGAMASSAQLKRRHGEDGLREWRATEVAAVGHVATLLADHRIGAETHSKGETQLAHSPRAWRQMTREAERIAAEYGIRATLHPPDALPDLGLGDVFHGGLSLEKGFALNPARYHAGLTGAADTAGARLFGQSPVTAITREGRRWCLTTPQARIKANKVLIATNGYASEDVPDWLRARTLPVQSSIVVTRPLTTEEQVAQGWTSEQMCYDSRMLLHYFRKLPDNRFLLGMRGGLTARPAEQRRISKRIRRNFHRLFPKWREVEITHEWSGLVCLMANLTPFCGPVPDMPGVFAGLGYHGNGVAMGSYTGALLAHVAGRTDAPGPYPAAMQAQPKRFPLGRYRRNLLAPAYAAATLFDR